MSVLLNASNSAGFQITPDNSGAVQLQANGSNTVAIDASGNVGIGAAPSTYKLNVYDATSSSLIVNGDSATSIVSSRASTDTSAATFQFHKYRGTQASPSVVADGDITGRIISYGYDGSALRVNAEIRSYVDGAPGASDMPGRLSFWTTPDGSTTVTERMRITSTGALALSGNATNYGTSGQVLTSAGDAPPTWTNVGMTLLGTITTTSGTSQSLTGLTLTSYKQLVLVFSNVSLADQRGSLLVGTSTSDDIAFTTSLASATNAWYGIATIDLTTGSFVSNINYNSTSDFSVVTGASTLAAAANYAGGDCPILTSSTSVSVASTYAFDAGSVAVYGVK